MSDQTFWATAFTILFFLCMYYVDDFRNTIFKAIFVLLAMIVIGWVAGVIGAAVICINTGELPWFAHYLGIFN